MITWLDEIPDRAVPLGVYLTQADRALPDTRVQFIAFKRLCEVDRPADAFVYEQRVLASGDRGLRAAAFWMWGLRQADSDAAKKKLAKQVVVIYPGTEEATRAARYLKMAAGGKGR